MFTEIIRKLLVVVPSLRGTQIKGSGKGLLITALLF